GRERAGPHGAGAYETPNRVTRGLLPEPGVSPGASAKRNTFNCANFHLICDFFCAQCPKLTSPIDEPSLVPSPRDGTIRCYHSPRYRRAKHSPQLSGPSTDLPWDRERNIDKWLGRSNG
ncbi:hypothetical protein GPALN_002164, partial [Globodera pallida]